MNRHDRIRRNLQNLQQLGVVDEAYAQNNMPGKRWLFTPAGFTERSMTTNEVEWFIMGAQSAIFAYRDRNREPS